MAIPEWVEFIGKLGPVSVAAAVLVMNISQNRWQNRISARATRVEDEKLRLSLLDRRANVIEALEVSMQDFHTNGRATPDMVRKIYDALKIAQLVYDDHEEHAVQGILKKTVTWQQLERSAERWRDLDQQKLHDAVDRMMDIETQLLGELVEVRKTLLAATKVRAVPPIADAPLVRLPWPRAWGLKRSSE